MVQRVKQAWVRSGDKETARIDKGLLILAGFARGDKEQEAAELAERIVKLRIFPDSRRDINRSALEAKGQLLAVSQFTLLADTSQGNRPSFIAAETPERARQLFNIFVERLRQSGLKVATGAFGQYMEVGLINEGPVTIIY